MWSKKPDIEKILLVDDDADDQILFLTALSEAAPGLRLESAASATAMTQVLGRYLPDIIFLDINMQQGNGFDCLTQLAAHPIYRTIPVVMHSSSRSHSDIARAYSFGASLYFHKPAHYAVLVMGLRKVLSLDWMQPRRVQQRHASTESFRAFNPVGRS